MQPKCSQNAAKMQPKCSQNAAKMQPKFSQNSVLIITRVLLYWIQNELEMDLKLTFLYLVFSGKSNDRVRINKHFCFNLLLVELLMVFGINQSSNGGKFNPICYTLGIFLHWTLLTTFLWSLLAGFQIYLMLVVIFETDTRMNR